MSRARSHESRLAALELQRPLTPAERRCATCGTSPTPRNMTREERDAVTARIMAKLARLAPSAVAPATPITLDTLFPRCATCGRRRARRPGGVT
jgi:hypothetical protein